MNCFTVVDSEVQVGISLGVQPRMEGLGISLGKNSELGGQRHQVGMKLDSPAHHVLVAGGICLMRTAQLVKQGAGNPTLMFSMAKRGLKLDTTDLRALVFLDFESSRCEVGYEITTYEDIPIWGFEKLNVTPTRFRIQALVVLKCGQYISFWKAQPEAHMFVTYDENPLKNNSLELSCLSAREFKRRQEQKVTVL